MRYIKIFWITLLTGFTTSDTFSQFNDTINYYANYTSTGIINKTNEGNSYVLNNQIKFNIYKKSVSLNTTNSWIYGQQLENVTNNDFFSVVDLNLFKSERNIYYWALGNFEKSYSLKINYRLQSGLGIGYYLIDKQNFVLHISDGILFEKSDLYDTEIGDNDYRILRNSFRIKFRLLVKDIFVLDNSDFLQHSLSDRKDYIIKSSTTLSLKLRKWLSFTIALNYNKLNLTKRENLLCNYGLTLERYF
jgi:hypothetical protein